MKEKALEIILNSESKLDSLEILKRIKSDYTSKDLEELLRALDSLIKEGKIRYASGNTYFKNDLLVGKIDMHAKGDAHVLIDGHEDVHISKSKLNSACDNDRVSVSIIDEKTNEGKVVTVLNRNLGKGIAEIIEENGEFYVKVLDEDKLQYNIQVQIDDDINLIDGLLLKIKYDRDLDKKNVLASVDYVIGHKNSPDVDTKLIAAEFDIPYEFPTAVLEEASNMPKTVTDEVISEELKKGRTDFRNRVIFTMDGKDTKDIDDALSIRILPNGNYELGVYIADVSHYVKKGSAIWNEAELRGNSNYLGNKVIPMLPIELSNGICSLNPNVDRLCLAYIMEIDHAGNTVNYDICEGIIKSRKKMNYDAVQDILESKETDDTKDYTTLEYVAIKNDTLASIAYENNMTVDELKSYNNGINEVHERDIINLPVKNILKNLSVLSKILQSMKKRRGMLEFMSDEVKFVFDEDNHVIDIKPHLQRESEKLVEDDMISANEVFALSSIVNKIPFAYRVHGEPSPKSIEDFLEFLTLNGIVYNKPIDAFNISNKNLQDLLEFLKNNLSAEEYKLYNKKLLRCMQKAYYSPDNIGHFGIASLNYSHGTSPIRRFEDLCDHYAYKEFILHGNTSVKDLTDFASYLSVVCEHISDTERTSQSAEYAMDDMLSAMMMLGVTDEEGNVIVPSHIGEEYDAIIDTCLAHSFFVQTTNFIEGRVDLSTLKDFYEFNQNNLSYTKNGKVYLKYGDKVRVKCASASKEKRQIDFELVRKL